ncbi:hypothetical protein [Saccharopolyspora cebuensis]|uniref:Uncharacterized protein n=1 Tax=Saccharopolyspora cebuensis TaxID=418759 RepID=A0ABV4CQS5_9PSEU
MAAPEPSLSQFAERALTAARRASADGTAALVVAVIPVVVVVIRILLVAGHDPAAVRILLTTLNIPAIALDATTVLVPVLLFFAMIRVLDWTLRREDPGTAALTLGFGVAIVVLLLPMQMAPWIVLPCAAYAAAALRRRTAGRVVLSAIVGQLSGLVLLGLAFVALFTPASFAFSMNQMWLPAEMITVRAADGTVRDRFPGYVLHSGDHHLTAMRHVPTSGTADDFPGYRPGPQFAILDPTAVRRELCSVPGGDLAVTRQSLAQLTGLLGETTAPAELPTCAQLWRG